MEPDPVMAADRRAGLLLEDLKKLDLDRNRQIAYLVKEDGAVGGAMAADPFMMIDRPDECPFAMAEQIRFDTYFRVHGGVERNEVAGNASLGRAERATVPSGTALLFV
jgi:hypothetical protein